MKLKINDNYFLETDALNYTLKEERVSQQGKVYTNTIGHYGSLEGLFKELVKHKIRVSESSDIYKLKQFIDKTMKDIEEFCNLHVNNKKENNYD